MHERSLRPSCLVAARLTPWYRGSRGNYNAASKGSKDSQSFVPTVSFVPGSVNLSLLPTAQVLKQVLVWMQELSARIRYSHVSMFQTKCSEGSRKNIVGFD